MTKQEVKTQLLDACKTQLGNRRQAVDAILSNVAHSLKEETKSSAGDKHETGRAMLQLERENAGKQLAEIEKLEALLQRVSAKTSSGPVHLGSVIETNQATYFLSIPSGKLIINNQPYYAIGIASPIGKILLGKNKGDKIAFPAHLKNNRENIIKVKSIY